jgi:cellulose synthase (UDP-forming)
MENYIKTPKFLNVKKNYRNNIYLRPLLSLTDQKKYIALTCVWAASLLYFWLWWFRPEHITNIFGYIIVSILQGWLTFLPLYFLFIFFKSKKPKELYCIPKHWRIAMIVTKAPSEPFDIVAETLTAILKQLPAHDTWLADEHPTQEVKDWCKLNGVKLSTRYGISEYHRTEWPRRTRCKEGNLAYFYDRYGYDNYDFVVQMDADHVPTKNYLKEILKPFINPQIGYVSAPSICDKNAKESWSARGRLFGEAALHGAIQAGHSGAFAPLCIGSHYAVRTIALKEIGGLGPELAEDHSTTLLMNKAHWRGVHAIDAIAHGDGPSTFPDLVTQEFQWARSLTTILITLLPKAWKDLPYRLRFQFLFSQLWYPLFSIFMLSGVLLPLIAITFQITYAEVTYPEYILHIFPMAFTLSIILFFIRKRDVLRPTNAPMFSWEHPVFLFARWPWTLLGVIMAIYDQISGRFVEFKVTPKSKTEVEPISIKILFPYLSIAIVSALVIMINHDIGNAAGFYYFAFINVVIYSFICLLVVWKHGKENKINEKNNINKLMISFFVLAIGILTIGGVAKNGSSAITAITYGLPYISNP